jgi:hypothetical protein
MAFKSIRNFIFPSLRLTAIFVVALSCVGCSTITTHTASGKKLVMSQEEFSKYVEHVFRYHNQVMNELMESAEDKDEMDSAEMRALSAAEAKMVEFCQPLNEVVSESLSGQSVGLQTQMKLVDTVPACEEASRIVDELMP